MGIAPIIGYRLGVGITAAASTLGISYAGITSAIGAIVALVGLGYTVFQANRKAKQDHDTEIAEARAAGRADRDDEVRLLTERIALAEQRENAAIREMEWWRNRAWESRGGPRRDGSREEWTNGH